MLDCAEAWEEVNPQNAPRIARKQLLQALHAMGLNPTKRQVNDFCTGKGSEACFSIDDLHALSQKVGPTDMNAVALAFQLLDDKGVGFVTRDQLRHYLMNFGERMTESEVQGVIDSFDSNNDGSIDQKEFVQMIVSLANECRKRVPTALPSTAAFISQQTAAAPSSSPAQKIQAKSPARPTATAASNANTNTTSASTTAPGSMRKSSSRTLMEPEEVQECREPHDLAEWDCSRSCGTFLADENAVACNVYELRLSEPSDIFISIRQARKTRPAIDCAVFLMSVPEDEEDEPELVASSQVQLQKDPFLRAHVDAGTYLLVPYSSGCLLKKRAAQPKKTTAITCKTKQGWELTSAAVAALKDVFRRIDSDGKGSLDRNEYDILLSRTDGEPCDDDTWQYITETFETNKGKLTFNGFVEIYNQILQANEAEGEDSLYANFEALGYNRNLELDEGLPFSVFVFTRKAEVLTSLQPMVYQPQLCASAALSFVLANGKRESLQQGVDLYTYRTSVSTLYACDNATKREVKVAVDVSRSRNACSSLSNNNNTSSNTVRVGAGSTTMLCALAVADAGSPWVAHCDVSVR
eukprot:m.46380 g.46380  ORF g.46380 m.46380 type:complete len:581 (-) comp12531_c0_seq1:2308-4050(-)